MNTPTRNLALFCDFENIALGVRDARYSAFDISKVLERLLLKGNIVVKKAYCDWARYKEFKPAMHEAAFELIEIPHLRMSGKNSADIRMVVDALDLCYTKSHVDTFVVISGDSDFSPLVSKLRENNKLVIGVGVKSSTSDLLTANCDEFIFYDDLVRDSEKKSERKQRAAKKKKTTKKAKKKTGKSAAKPNGDSAGDSAGDSSTGTPADVGGSPGPIPRARKSGARRPSTWCWKPSRRCFASATSRKRSGAPWSSRRSSDVAPDLPRAITGSNRLASCSRK